MWVTLFVCLAAGFSVQAATGRVIKVLPQLLDSKGRNSLAPSLYERDAYQASLRAHTNQIASMQFVVQWKTKGTVTGPLKLKVQIRGTAHGSLPTEMWIEKIVEPGGWFSRWTTLYLGHDDYKSLVDVTSWRVTLWDGDRQISEQKSFLW